MGSFTIIFVIAAGVFCIYCSYKDYDWFFDNHRARPFVSLFGREGARKFYYVLGGILIFLGLLILFSLPGV